MIIEALVSCRIIYANQNRNREFISLLAYIRADGTILLPALIYKSDFSTL